MTRIAGFLRAIADRLAPEPWFDDLEDEATASDWAGLIVLHAEGVHGCDHTADARAALGMYDPDHPAVTPSQPVSTGWTR